MNRLHRILESVTTLCLSLWVGAMTGFAFTAPELFRAWGPDRQRAGDTAGTMITRINNLGIILGGLAVLALLPRLKSRLQRWRAAAAAGALTLALVTALMILPQISRAQPPHPIQTYAETDPIRVNYNRWHKRSEQVFGLAILLGAVVILLGPFEKEAR